jgi:hypothetical protein
MRRPKPWEIVEDKTMLKWYLATDPSSSDKEVEPESQLICDTEEIRAYLLYFREEEKDS